MQSFKETFQPTLNFSTSFLSIIHFLGELKQKSERAVLDGFLMFSAPMSGHRRMEAVLLYKFIELRLAPPGGNLHGSLNSTGTMLFQEVTNA